MNPFACSQTETLFADYLDETLNEQDRLKMDAHIAGCASCSELVADMRLAMEYAREAGVVEPPPELVTRIIEQTSGLAPVGVPKWRHRVHVWWDLNVTPVVRPMLEPRMALGLAMTVISFSMLLNLAGVDIRRISLSDLAPAKMVRKADSNLHLAGANAHRYFDSLRVVYEIQSQLQALRDERDSETPKTDPNKPKENAPAKGPAQNKQTHDKLNRNWTRPFSVTAVILLRP